MNPNTQQGKPDGAFSRAKRVSEQALRYSLPFAICIDVLALAGTVSCHYLERRSLAEFFLSLLTIVLSSSMIRTATDRVVQSLQADDHEFLAAMVDSLLGNAAETCFVVIAVALGKLDIAKTALCGSLLANSLFTFGACLMVGGLQQKTLTYPVAMIRINAQLLIVKLFSVVLPTAFKIFSDESNSGLLSVSRASAVVLFVEFLYYFWSIQCSLLKKKQTVTNETVGNVVFGAGLIASVSMSASMSASMRQLLEEHQRMKKERRPSSSLWTGLSILPFSIAALAVASLLLLESVDAPIHAFHISPSFLGLIIMPCVLASIDYVSGVLRSKPIEVAEIAGEAFMSSIRISMLVFPIAVILGWALNVPMDMLLDGFQVSVLVLAVLMANHATHGEIAYWLEGTMFIAASILFEVASAYYPNTV